jgi:hypothetical protein
VRHSTGGQDHHAPAAHHLLMHLSHAAVHRLVLRNERRLWEDRVLRHGQSGRSVKNVAGLRELSRAPTCRFLALDLAKQTDTGVPTLE